MRAHVLIATFLILLVPEALAQVSHPAGDVTPGNFSTGDYRLPSGVLYVGNALGGLTATDARTTLFDPSGAGKLYVTTTGVGIGTAAPTQLLSIANAPNGGGLGLTSTQSGAVSGPGIIFRGWTGSTNTDAMLQYTGGGNFQFGTINGATNWLTIQSSDGNVGIGTTSPIQKLDVIGNIKGTQLCIGADCRSSWPAGNLGGSGAATQVAFFNSSTSVTSDANFFWDNTNKRLGVGTSAPSVPLEIQRSGETDVELESTGAGARRWGFVVNPSWKPSSFSIYDATADNARFLIDTSGNLGIGTTSPNTNLHVRDVATGNTKVRIDGAGGTPELQFTNNQGSFVLAQPSATGDLTFATASGSGERVTFTRVGRVGIGTTTPQRLLHLNGGSDSYARFDTNLAGKDNWVIGADTYGFLVFSETDGAYRMVVDTNGNVGIGTTSPTQGKLVVSGGAIAADTSNNYFVDLGPNNRFRICGPNGGCSTAGELIAGRIRLSADGGFANAQGQTDPGMGGINAPGNLYVGGNVGIGTTNPNAKLDVNGAVLAANGLSSGYLIRNVANNGNIAALYADTGNNVILDSPSSGLLSLKTSGVERVRITDPTFEVFGSLIHANNNVQRVGINTNSPTQTLDINGNLRARSLASCDTIDTDANGNLLCGTDNSGDIKTKIISHSATASYGSETVVQTHTPPSGKAWLVSNYMIKAQHENGNGNAISKIRFRFTDGTTLSDTIGPMGPYDIHPWSYSGTTTFRLLTSGSPQTYTTVIANPIFDNTHSGKKVDRVEFIADGNSNSLREWFFSGLEVAV